jgi:hypothetical protein
LREDEADEDEEAVTGCAVDRAREERRGETIAAEETPADYDEQEVLV